MTEFPPFGALLQMTTREGERDDVLRVLTNYVHTLDGEPGTLLFAVAADPDDPELIWVRPLAPVLHRVNPGVTAE